MKNLKIYTANGETLTLENANWDKIKTQIASKNYDGSFTMTNGDIIVIL
jgi:hypothetical protein